MKKMLVMVVLILFLTNLAIVSAANENQNKLSAQAANSGDDSQVQTKTEAGEMERERIRNATHAENRLRIAESDECPANCTCDGSATRCSIEGGREMTIRAGNSGNTIVQVKGEEMQTSVELYKSDGKVYGVFRGNQTRAIEVLPDEVREKIQERLRTQNQTMDIELDDDGNYQIQTQKRARLFGIIPVRERVRVEMNSETGEITRERNSWWGFLAKDVEENTQ